MDSIRDLQFKCISEYHTHTPACNDLIPNLRQKAISVQGIHDNHNIFHQTFESRKCTMSGQPGNKVEYTYTIYKYEYMNNLKLLPENIYVTRIWSSIHMH